MENPHCPGLFQNRPTACFHSFFLLPQPVLAPFLCLSNPYRVFGTYGNPTSSLEPLLISRFRHNPSLLLYSFSRCCAGVDSVRVLCPTDMGTAFSPSLKRIYHEAFHEGESETNRGRGPMGSSVPVRVKYKQTRCSQLGLFCIRLSHLLLNLSWPSHFPLAHSL